MNYSKFTSPFNLAKDHTKWPGWYYYCQRRCAIFLNSPSKMAQSSMNMVIGGLWGNKVHFHWQKTTHRGLVDTFTVHQRQCAIFKSPSKMAQSSISMVIGGLWADKVHFSGNRPHVMAWLILSQFIRGSAPFSKVHLRWLDHPFLWWLEWRPLSRWKIHFSGKDHTSWPDWYVSSSSEANCHVFTNSIGGRP